MKRWKENVNAIKREQKSYKKKNLSSIRHQSLHILSTIKVRLVQLTTFDCFNLSHFLAK